MADLDQNRWPVRPESALLSDLGFELRRSSKQGGKFLDSLELSAYPGHLIDQVLLDHAGLNITLQKDSRGGDILVMQNGLDTRGRPNMCEPEVWIDGFRIRVNAQSRLRGVTSNEIFGVEVFSPLQLPPIGIGGSLGEDQAGLPRKARCGVVVVWTKAYINDLKKRERRDPLQ